jgi:membrane-associated phospholipid phosphatase
MSTQIRIQSIATARPLATGTIHQIGPARCALLLALLAFAALNVDVAVSAKACSGRLLRGDLHKCVQLHEFFGHAAGMAAALLAIVLLDAGRRRGIWRLIAAAGIAGLGSLALKVLIGRIRPHCLPTDDFPARFHDTFIGLLPYQRAAAYENGFRAAIQSFPSGHAATAAVLALGLSFLYPRGRWLFAFLAAMAMLQRVVSGAHFPSDVLAGGALGCLAFAFCSHRLLLGSWFDRLENRYG